MCCLKNRLCNSFFYAQIIGFVFLEFYSSNYTYVARALFPRKILLSDSVCLNSLQWSGWKTSKRVFLAIIQKLYKYFTRIIAFQKRSNTVKRGEKIPIVQSARPIKNNIKNLFNLLYRFFFVHFCYAGLPIHCFKRKIRQCLHRVSFMNVKIKKKKIYDLQFNQIQLLATRFGRIIKKNHVKRTIPLRTSKTALHAPIQRNAPRCTITFNRIWYIWYNLCMLRRKR